MDENAELILRKICCTCLSLDRKLNQLCRVDNGVNNLYFLLSHDPVAYDAMFYQNPTHLFVCWECKARMHGICKFREQACKAQKQLSDLIDGKTNSVCKIRTLSQLTCKYRSIYEQELTDNDETFTDFIDCGLNLDTIKSDSDLDTPQCDLHDESVEINANRSVRKCIVKRILSHEMSDSDITGLSVFDEINDKCQFVDDERVEADKFNNVDSPFLELKGKIQFGKVKNIIDTKCLSVQLSNAEANERLEKIKEDRILQDTDHIDVFKCKLCALVFKDQNELEMHISQHSEVEDRQKIKKLKSTRKKKTMSTDKKYVCTECNKYFVNRNQKLKHMMIFHHSGFPCAVCGKVFTSRNHMVRHETIHFNSFRREQCPVCGRMVRCDLTKAHALIHSERKKYKCIECDKQFVSGRSYENHLKYTANHAVRYREFVLKYKCLTCSKGYRSKTELRDHINYNHMGKTEHKCPICGKAIATPRGVTRHVKRAHQGIKENARDKICQTCGKAFRYKKVLEEHERIHTGERPLSCTICGQTFRQKASLYTHNRRVHKMAPKQRVIEHAD